jgi:hypothetical protein
VPQLSLSGQPLPPRLTCTATVFASGEIGPVAVIRRTMSRVDKLDVEHEQDALERGAVLDRRSTTGAARGWPWRDQRLDQLPQPIIDQPLLLSGGTSSD